MNTMALVGIGEAARKLGINTSALRYYEERGLVRPAARTGGRRMYGPEELRRLAFLQLMQRLGMSLDDACTVLDEAGDTWRATVREKVSALGELIERAEAARHFLEQALKCPAEHPTRECPYMTATLDRRIAGASFEELAAEHGHTTRPPRKGFSEPAV
jgi:DNA-binding transcriptional MerR regulator